MSKQTYKEIPAIRQWSQEYFLAMRWWARSYTSYLLTCIRWQLNRHQLFHLDFHSEETLGKTLKLLWARLAPGVGNVRTSTFCCYLTELWEYFTQPLPPELLRGHEAGHTLAKLLLFSCLWLLLWVVGPKESRHRINKTCPSWASASKVKIGGVQKSK